MRKRKIKIRKHRRRTNKGSTIVKQHIRKIKQPIRLSRRECWKCHTPLTFSGMCERNPDMDQIKLAEIWKRPEVEILCCRCYQEAESGKILKNIINFDELTSKQKDSVQLLGLFERFAPGEIYALSRSTDFPPALKLDTRNKSYLIFDSLQEAQGAAILFLENQVSLLDNTSAILYLLNTYEDLINIDKYLDLEGIVNAIVEVEDNAYIQKQTIITDPDEIEEFKKTFKAIIARDPIGYLDNWEFSDKENIRRIYEKNLLLSSEIILETIINDLIKNFDRVLSKGTKHILLENNAIAYKR